MIQINAFRHAKSMALQPLGYASEVTYQYWGDTRRQWDDSLDPRKMLDLVGSQNGPGFRLIDLQRTVGDLSATERKLELQFRKLYADIAKIVTSAGADLDLDLDWMETVLDMRRLQPYLQQSKRILDVGPGAGRHMVSLALAGMLKTRNYVGMECITLPYVLQSLIASVLAAGGNVASHVDQLDYHLGHLEFPSDQALSPNAIAQVPFWNSDDIPAGSVDLILCTYVLDEIAPNDFVRLMTVIDRVLAPGGIVYCRGSQERALRPTQSQYGYDRRHGQDITGAFHNLGLIAIECDVVVDTLTRVFVRPEGDARQATSCGQHTSDATLIPALSQDFNESVVKTLSEQNARVVIWGEAGYRHNQEVFDYFRSRLNIVGVTSRAAKQESVMKDGYTEYPIADLPRLNPDAVIFLSYRFNRFYLELRDLMPAETFKEMRHFLTPVAVAFK